MLHSRLRGKRTNRKKYKILQIFQHSGYAIKQFTPNTNGETN